MLFVLVLAGCQNQPAGPKRSILVFHSYENKGEEGAPFRWYMEREFSKQGINAEVHHVYLDRVHRTESNLERNLFSYLLDSIQNIWKPEVILVNDDPAYRMLLSDRRDRIYREIPVVFSGVNLLIPDTLQEHENFTGFEDRIDYARNLELVHQITKDPNIIIELDSLPDFDDYLRNDLYEVLQDTLFYVNNGDFHLHNLFSVGQRKICVTPISLLNPILNSSKKNDMVLARENTNTIHRNAGNYHFLNVKHDIFSEVFIKQSGVPQFTAIREGFGNREKPIYLCGYFTDLQTQISDQVSYAVRILNGEQPRKLPVGIHAKNYHMDYNALKILGTLQQTEANKALKELDFETCKDIFHMANIPYRINRPKLFWGSILLSAAFLLSILGFLFFILIRKQVRARKIIEEEIKAETHLNTQILNDTNSSVWRFVKGEIEMPLEFAKKNGIPKKIKVEDMSQMISEDTLLDFQELVYGQSYLGQKKIRIKISFDQQKTWHWYDVICNLTEEAIQNWTLSGLFINVDDEIEHEKQLEKALAQAREIELKEHFLENISSNLQSPLQQVRYHARMITDPETVLSQEEKTELSHKINVSVQSLLDNIDSVVKSTSKVILLPIFFLCCGSFCGCEDSREPLKVMIIHQYDKKLKGYEEFHEAITQTFLSSGYTPEYRHIYLDLLDQSVSPTFRRAQFIDSVNAGSWKADVILAEGDRTAWYTSDSINSNIPSYRNKVPMVYGGIANPNWNKLGSQPNTTVITDPLDLTKNVNLAHEFSNDNFIVVEMDYFRDDLPIREQIQKDLKPAPYIDNSDFHLKSLSENTLSGELKDSIIVMTYSAYDTDSNAHKGTSEYIGPRLVMEQIMNSSRHPHLVLKYDIYGDAFSTTASLPQYTSRRELLGNGEANFLAGYFADYKTIGKDMAEAAIYQIQGKRNVFSTRTHEKHYFMDYDAMKAMGLDYQNFKKQYIIKNVPEKVANSLRYQLTRASLAFLALLAFTSLIYFVRRASKKRNEQIRIMLKDEHELGVMALQGARNHYIANHSEMKNMIELIDPSYQEQIQQIKHTLNLPGKYMFRIHAAIELAGRYDWWQLRYAVAEDKNGDIALEGLLININESIAYEQKLRKAEELEKEAKLKEKFLWKIAHEIRTPLNSIMGFSQILASTEVKLAEDEKEDMRIAIQDSSDALQKIITDIIQYAHIINKKEMLKMEDVNVGDFVCDLAQRAQNWIKRKPNIELEVVPGRNGIHIEADEEKLNKALMQLLDNARKFTDKGKIIIGWDYNLERKEAEIYVEDYGQGIPEDKLPALFSMFWKNNSFIPGLGIGLNIALSYAKEMNGNLTVETEEGNGSRFMLTFPAKQL